MTDRPPESSEPAASSPSRAWLGLSVLTWSIVASMLLHGSVLIPAFLDFFKPSGAEVDLEWLKSFENLEGLGHGSSGRFAQIDEASFRTLNEEPEPALPEVAPEPEPEPEPEPADVEPEAEPEPAPPEEVQEEAVPKEQPPAEEQPPQDAKPQEVASEGDLPGLDRAGPNGLPAMEGFGPGNAVFSALVRLDRIRGSRFETPARELLEAVPDYRILLQGTEVDPLADIDSMFMASAEPMYIEQTFLAVRHRLGADELRRRLDQRFEAKIAWASSGGHPTRELVPPGSRYDDPRQIMVPGDELALVVRPEWLDEIDDKLVGLRQIERAANESDTLVLMSAMGARLALPGIGRLTFDGAKVEIAGLTRPRLTIDLTLATQDEARRFASGCPGLKRRLLAQVPWIAKGITRMVVDRLTCVADGRFVSVEGTYTADEVERLLNIALPFVPRPPELAYLPPAPRKPTLEAPDAGADTGRAPTPAASELRDAAQADDQ